jgi:hypothetical protein
VTSASKSDLAVPGRESENVAVSLPRGRRKAQRAAIGLALALAGCAGLKNTPEQDVAYARWAACEPRSGLADIDRVEPSGRIWFTYYSESERLTVVECLAKTPPNGPSLPSPVAVLRGKGGA